MSQSTIVSEMQEMFSRRFIENSNSTVVARAMLVAVNGSSQVYYSSVVFAKDDDWRMIVFFGLVFAIFTATFGFWFICQLYVWPRVRRVVSRLCGWSSLPPTRDVELGEDELVVGWRPGPKLPQIILTKPTSPEKPASALPVLDENLLQPVPYEEQVRRRRVVAPGPSRARSASPRPRSASRRPRKSQVSPAPSTASTSFQSEQAQSSESTSESAKEKKRKFSGRHKRFKNKGGRSSSSNASQDGGGDINP